eukprot:885042-Pleurochrysis_carterae.AAC.1
MQALLVGHSLELPRTVLALNCPLRRSHRVLALALMLHHDRMQSASALVLHQAGAKCKQTAGELHRTILQLQRRCEEGRVGGTVRGLGQFAQVVYKCASAMEVVDGEHQIHQHEGPSRRSKARKND